MLDINEVIKKQRIFFNSGTTKSISFRKEQLKKLRDAIVKNEEQIMDALKKDLNKSSFEAYATEIGIVLDEIRFMLKHLDSWAKPRKVKTPISQFKATSRIYKEPYGVVLIMAPWNYPFQLALAPLVGAIAAGNCAVIKPSEDAKNTSAILYKMMWQNFDPAFIAVVQGGIEESQALLKERFDYIFFTGSVSVGKIVMEAAAKYLTPVTLELGGKSPCIVDETANLELAAKRIIWGKLINAGQTCVAPDYVLVQKNVKVFLIEHMIDYIRKFYGDYPIDNQDYVKIVNEKHFRRLLGLMKSGSILYGGQYDEINHKIAPTILDKVSLESPVMQEEIFGPILPILEFDSLNEAIDIVKKREKPLALYLFTTDKKAMTYTIDKTSFGGGCINDTIVHLVSHDMPFGGVGESGIGAYHGKASFDVFTHEKSVLNKSNRFDIPLRYPPYKKSALKTVKRFMK